MSEPDISRMMADLLSRAAEPPPSSPPPAPPVDRQQRADEDQGMEKRMGEFEKAIVRIDSTLEHMRADITDIKDSVKTWKWQVLGAALAVLLAVLSGNYAIQQMTVATFVAAAQQQKDAQPQPAPLPPIIINVPAAAQPASSPSR